MNWSIAADLGGDEEHVQAVEGLVNIADAVRFDKCVLFPCCHQLWEGCHKALGQNLQLDLA